MAKTTTRKKTNNAYVVPCSTRFRGELELLLQSRNDSNGANDNVGLGDLARAVMLLIPQDIIESQPDPGDPDKNDRDIVTIRGGKAGGRTMPRKPRLQVRISQKTNAATIRKALGLALSLEKGWASLMLDGRGTGSAAHKLANAQLELQRLQGMIEKLAFQPLERGVRTRLDALYVLGFSSSAAPTPAEIKSRYRSLAMIFHPDSGHSSSNAALRIAQLSDAVKILTK